MSTIEKEPCGSVKTVPRFRVLDVMLSGLKISEASQKILDISQDKKAGHYVCVFAVDSLLKCHKDSRLADAANGADLTLCDGMPLVNIGRKVAKIDMNRCYGPDVMLRVLEEGQERGTRHYFYGGKNDEVMEKLKNNLKEKFPKLTIAGSYVPPFRPLTEEEELMVIDDIKKSEADVVWVGIGTPKQDFFVKKMHDKIGQGIMVAVGAAFDFHAGTLRQAPLWMRKNSLEWLFRLVVEPRRLWRRYILGNPYFIFLLLKQFITKKPGKLGEVK